MKVAAVRTYRKTPYGKRIVLEAWAENVAGDVAKRRPLPKEAVRREGSLDGADEIRVLVYTSPAAVSGIPKKVPELMEVPIGGDDVSAAYTYADDILGKAIDAENVFKEGMLVDVIAVTKGKGVQGPVKRWGVTIQKIEKPSGVVRGATSGILVRGTQRVLGGRFPNLVRWAINKELSTISEYLKSGRTEL